MSAAVRKNSSIGSAIKLLSAVAVFAASSVYAAPPVMDNNPPQIISNTEALLWGNLLNDGGDPPEVYVYWGTTDGDVTPGSWDTNSYLGIRPGGVVSNYVSGLLTNTQYYYRYYATNSAGDSWAPATTNFMTVMGGPPDPHIYYRFDGNLFDDGPGGYDLAPTGSPTHPAGVINQGVSLSFADFLSTSGISNPQNIQTLDTWVMISDTNSLQHIADLNDGSDSNALQLVYDDISSAFIWRLRIGGTDIWQGGFPGVVPSSWYHVVGTCGPMGAELFINGTSAWATNDTTVPVASMNALNIGADAIGSNDMNGEIDNMAFFDYPYLTNDVINSYNGGSGIEFGGAGGSNIEVRVFMEHIGIVGTPMSYTVEVFKEDGAPASNFVGDIEFNSHDVGATYSSSYNFTGSEGGIVTLTNDLTFSSPGFWEFEAYPMGEPWKGSSTDVIVFNGGGTNTTHFYVDAHPRPIISGMWHELAVIALDDEERVNASHTNSITFTSSAGGATWATTPFSAFSNGWAIIEDQMILTVPGEQLITVTSQIDTNAWGETKAMVFGGGAIYFVSEFTGANTNSGTGPGSAWRDINYAAGVVSAGDVVIVEPGVYNESVNLTAAGAAGSYITFIGDMDGDYFPSHGEIFMNPAPGQPAFFLNNAHYNAICGFDMETVPGSTGIVSTSSTDGYFFDNQVDGYEAGVALNSSPGTIVRDNEFDKLADFGIKLTGSSSGTLLDNNRIDMCFNGIEVDGAMTGVELIWNDINSPTNTGILIIGGAEAKLKNNVVSEGSGAGIELGGSGQVHLLRNLIFNNSGPGLSVTNSSAGNSVSNNVFYMNDGGVRLMTSPNCTVKNNIMLSNSSSGIYIDPASTNGLLAEYNCAFSHTMNWDGVATPGTGSISVAPLFANLSPGDEDFHLQSSAGRYNNQGGWVSDGSDSPCIDAGDPGAPFGNEPMPNGGRINMGAFGDTHDASRSPAPPPVDLFISSLYGAPDPPAGTNWFPDGTTTNCSVAPVVPDGVGTQQVCTGWSGTGSVPALGNSNSVVVTVTNSSTLSWNWQAEVELQIITNGLGSVTPGPMWHPQFTNVLLTATPGSNQTFTGWSGDTNGIPDPTMNVVTAAMDSAKTLIANFVVTTNDLYVASLYGTPTPGTGTTWLTEGSLVNASVGSPLPDGIGTQQVCQGWSGTGSVPLLGNSNSVSFNITNSSSLSWNWQSEVYLTVNPMPNGSVDVGDGWYDQFTNVTVTATPTNGYTFAGWTGDITGPDAATNITMDKAYSITPNFTLLTHTITSTAGPNGGITPTGAVVVADSANQLFTFTPALNHHVSDVTVNGSSVGPTNSYTFVTVTSNQSINVSFAPDTGSIRCTLTPGAADAFGGQWQIVELPGWRGSGQVANNIPVGPTYTIQFSGIAGWNTPANINGVTVSAGPIAEHTGNYTQQGLRGIPGGSFLMGIFDGIGGVPVTLTSFQMDVTEVTVADYMVFANATGYGMPPVPDGWSAWTDNTSRPMCNVKWNEAAAYAAWMGKCLPTEAQFEYAMRDGVNGTNDNRYTYGDDITLAQANYNNPGATVPDVVGAKAPSPTYNLDDLAGNVWEWCYDWYSDPLPGGNDPSGPAAVQTFKTKRGGAWINPKTNLRCSRRYSAMPRMRYRDVGFRCVYPGDGRTPDGDTNNNGIPDWWEMYYFGLSEGGAGGTFNAGLDSDGDGASNAAEYTQGTDPTDPAALFAVNGQFITVPSAGFVLEWPSGANPRFYRIERATNAPTGPWSSVVSNIPSLPSPDGYTMAINVHTDFTASASAWYRIVVNVNPE